MTVCEIRQFEVHVHCKAVIRLGVLPPGCLLLGSGEELRNVRDRGILMA